jgi:hypothetical protein
MICGERLHLDRASEDEQQRVSEANNSHVCIVSHTLSLIIEICSYKIILEKLVLMSYLAANIFLVTQTRCPLQLHLFY